MRITNENLQNYKKVFVFGEYRDKAGSGSQEYFDSLEEAIDYARKEWEHLADSDKKSYLKDSAGHFMVTENEVIEEEGDYYPNLEPLNVFWDAFKHQKKIDLKEEIEEKENYIKQLRQETDVELYGQDYIKEKIEELQAEIEDLQNKIAGIERR